MTKEQAKKILLNEFSRYMKDCYFRYELKPLDRMERLKEATQIYAQIENDKFLDYLTEPIVPKPICEMCEKTKKAEREKAETERAALREQIRRQRVVAAIQTTALILQTAFVVLVLMGIK